MSLTGRVVNAKKTQQSAVYLVKTEHNFDSCYFWIVWRPNQTLKKNKKTVNFKKINK